MSWSACIRALFNSAGKKQSKARERASLVLEHLEERIVLYSASGNAWPNPALITISFMPDGTQMSSAVGSTITSNLFSTFDGKFGSPAGWENQILKAAQVWAQQTNINFTIVPDDGAPSGSGSYQQGSPGFGDIRIGGYNFGNSTLGNTFYPPQENNYSIAGDVALNTGQVFNIGSTYDLFTVASHEIGHALGLGESSASTSAIMYGSYTGLKSGLASDDIVGIRNIYSSNNPRTADTAGKTITAATNITSLISTTSLTALDSNLDLATTTQTDWFTFTAPTGTASRMTVQLQSQGLSLLSPKETVYAADGTTVLGSASGLNKYGTTLDVSVTGVSAGEQFYVKAQGADTTAFSTGDYALALNFGSGATPMEASPIQEIPNGTPPSGGGGVADNPACGDSYLDSVPKITGITPDNGLSSIDAITNTPNLAFTGSAPAGNLVQLFLFTNNTQQYLGSTLVNGQNQWTWTYSGSPLTSGNYTFAAIGVDSRTGFTSNLSYPLSVTIKTSVPGAPTVSVNNPLTGTPIVFSNVTTPVVSGAATPNSAISVFVNGKLVVAQSGANCSTMSDSEGNWCITLPGELSNGVYTVTATAMTVAGTTGAVSAPYTFMVTSSGVNSPVITGVEPASGTNGPICASVVNSAKIKIAGLADAGAMVSLYQSSGGSKTLLGTSTADITGHWIYDYSHTSLSAGTYTFSATETTSAGSSGSSQTFTATVMLSTPSTPSITGLASTSTPGNGLPPVAPPSHMLLGTGPAGDTINVFLANQQIGSTTASSSGNWSFNFGGLSLQTGNNNFTAQAVDAAGNEGSTSHSFTVTVNSAPSSPVVTRFNPAYSGYSTGLTTSLTAGTVVASYTNSQTPTLSGMATAGSYVEIFENAVYAGFTTSNSSGNWSYTTQDLQNGIYNFSAVTVASTGLASASSNSVRIIVDTQAPNPPTFVGITPDTGVAGDNITSSRQISLFGTADTGTGVHIFVAANGFNTPVLIGAIVANGSGNWTFNYTNTRLAAGTYQFTATETDLAGNTSKMSQNFAVTIDLTTPDTPVIIGLTLASKPGGNQPPVTQPSQVLVGTADPGDTVNVFLGNNQVGSTTANPQGNWSFNFGGMALQTGNNYFTTQAMEVAGNQSTVSAAYDLVATQAPPSPQIQSFSPAYSGVNTGYTNSATPTLSGNASPGAYVEVYENGSYAGYTMASANGSWSYTVPQGLQDGTYSFTAVTVSLNGVSGPASYPMNLTVKMHAPNAPVISSFTPNTGAAGDNITNSQQIKLYGTADPGTTVNVYQNSGGGNTVLIGAVTVTSSGNWTFDYSHTLLAAGTYTFTATETDLAGNTGQGSQGFAVTIDLTIPHTPVITALAPTSIPGGNLPPVAPVSQVLLGTADPTDTVNVFLNNQQIGSVTASPQGNWSFDFAGLSLDNSNSFTAQAVEVAGNESTVSAAYGVTDAQAPNAPLLQSFSPAYSGVSAGYTNSATPTLHGSAPSGTYVEVYDNGSYAGYTMASANGSWSYTMPQGLQDGTYSFTAVTLNSGGVSSTASSALNLMVKTHAPNTPVITGYSPDTGVLGDHITNSQQIILSGFAGPGTSINVYQNSGGGGGNTVMIGAVTVANSGSWTFNYGQTTTLAAGTYTFTATETDLAGNTGLASQSFAITIDRTIPDTPVITGLAPTSNPSSGLPAVASPSYVLVGTSDANDTINVFLNNQLVGATTADNHGNWSFNFANLPLQTLQRSNSFTVQAVEVAGNQSALSRTFTVNAYTTPNAPQIQGFSPAYSGISAGYTNSSTPALFGTGPAGDYVELFQNGSYVGYVTATANGSWSYTSNNLGDGANSFTALTLSPNGVSSVLSNVQNLIVKTHIGNAQIQGISPDTGLHNNDGITNAQNLMIFGQSDPNVTIRVFQNGVSLGTTTANSSGNWTFNNTANTLSQGTYRFTVQASDLAGNFSPVSQAYQVVIITTPPPAPVIAGISETSNNYGQQTLVLNGQAQANSQVTVYLGGTAIWTGNANGQGSWSCNYNSSSANGQFANGTYLFTATAKDVAGNMSVVSSPFQLLLGNRMQNLSAPQLTAACIISNNNGNISTTETPTFTGNANAGTLVTVVDGSVLLGTAVANASGHWSFTSSGLATGNHNVSVFATDSLGDEGLLSNPLTFQTTPVSNVPTFLGITPDTGVVGDNITSSQQIMLFGTADAGNTVSLYVGASGTNPGIFIGSTTASSTGPWTFDYTHTTLAAGTYSFTAMATNATGNTSQASQGFTVTIDLTTPSTPVITGLAPTSAPVGNLPPIAPASQVVVGTSDANDTINVFLNNQQVGATTAGNNGAWSFDFGNLSLQAGSYSFTAGAVEIAGHQSALSSSYAVTVNPAPNAPQIQGFSPAYSGVSAGYTNSPTPSIYGTAPAGADVEVFRNGTYAGYTTAAANGAWSYTSNDLLDGAYSFTAMTLSSKGVSSALSSPLNLIVKTHASTAPAISEISPDTGVVGDGITSSQQIAVLGTADAGTTVYVYLANGGGNGTLIGSVTVNSSGNWSCNVNQKLAAGTYAFTATETDLAGNTSQASQNYAVTIDLTIPDTPVITGLAATSKPGGNLPQVSPASCVLVGTSDANNTINVFANNQLIGTTTAANNGAWSFNFGSLALPAGNTSFTAGAVEVAGNQSALSETFAVNLFATPGTPQIQGFSPAYSGVSAGYTNSSTPALFGTGPAGDYVELFQNGSYVGYVTATANGSWSYTSNNLSDGANSFTALALSPNGVSSVLSNVQNLIVKTHIGNAQIQGISPDTGLHNNDGITNAQNIMINGQSDPNVTIQLFQNGVSLGTTTANSSGNWTFNNTANTLSQGTYRFTVQASDLAGNFSPVSQAYQVVIITTPPPAPVIAGISETSNNNGQQTLVLNGQAQANSQVTVYLGGTAIWTGNANGQGSWSCNYNSSSANGQFANGTYLFTATAKDVAGNVSNISSTIKLLLGSTMQNLSAPQLTNASIISNNNGNITAVSTPTITGNAQSGTLVTIVDGNSVLGTVVTNTQGHWTFTCPTLASGHHSISVFAADSQGDEGLLSNALVFQI